VTVFYPILTTINWTPDIFILNPILTGIFGTPNPTVFYPKLTWESATPNPIVFNPASCVHTIILILIFAIQSFVTSPAKMFSN
jgi:hypothetical protein